MQRYFLGSKFAMSHPTSQKKYSSEMKIILGWSPYSKKSRTFYLLSSVDCSQKQEIDLPLASL